MSNPQTECCGKPVASQTDRKVFHPCNAKQNIIASPASSTASRAYSLSRKVSFFVLNYFCNDFVLCRHSFLSRCGVHDITIKTRYSENNIHPSICCYHIIMSAATAIATNSSAVSEDEETVVGRMTNYDHATTAAQLPRPTVSDSGPGPCGLELLPTPGSCIATCRCNGCEGASAGDGISKPHHKQLYFWHTHFSPKLLPSIDQILREEGPAGTVRVLSCTGLVAEAVSLVLRQSAKVSTLVVSGLAPGDVPPTMEALHRAVAGDGGVGLAGDDDAVTAVRSPCAHCRRPSSVRMLRILETSLGNDADDDDEVSLSLFDFLGHPGCGIQQLDLSKCKLSSGAVRSLARALSRNTTINVLKLNHVQFVVGNVVPMEELDGDLSRNSDHSRAGFQSASASPSSCPLATILKAFIENPTEQPSHRRYSSLRELHLSHVVSEGDEAMTALCRLLPTLETLDLSGSQWRSARSSSTAAATLPSSAGKLNFLIDVMTRSDNNAAPFCLKHLVLTGIPLSEIIVSKLCRALEHPVAGPLRQLESIELQNCQLTEASMLGMMEIIPRWSSSLSRVDLARNFFRPAIVGGLLNALQRNYVLQDLGRPLLLHDKTYQSQHQLLEYYLDCNWAGRRVFRQSSSCHSHQLGTSNDVHRVTPELWPHLLERINHKPIRRTKHHYSHDGPGRRESLLFAMLRGPALLEPRYP